MSPFNVAYYYLKDGKYEKALKFLTQTEALHTGEVKYNGYCKMIAFCFYKLGQLEKSIASMTKHIGKAVEVNDHLILSSLNSEKGNKEEAAKHFQQEKDLFPGNTLEVQDVERLKAIKLENLFNL